MNIPKPGDIFYDYGGHICLALPWNDGEREQMNAPEHAVRLLFDRRHGWIAVDRWEQRAPEESCIKREMTATILKP